MLWHVVAPFLVVALAACGTAPSTQAPEDRATASTAAQEVPSEILNPDVRQETIDLTICIAGYTATVRTSTTYTSGVKVKLMRELGLLASAARDFELDHHVLLALGGHPRALANLTRQLCSYQLLIRILLIHEASLDT